MLLPKYTLHRTEPRPTTTGLAADLQRPAGGEETSNRAINLTGECLSLLQFHTETHYLSEACASKRSPFVCVRDGGEKKKASQDTLTKQRGGDRKQTESDSTATSKTRWETADTHVT